MFLKVLGETELVFRLPGIFCFWGAIVAAYWLGRDLHGPLLGSLTALILACRPFVVSEVRFARVYGLSLLLATLAFWFAVRWLRAAERAAAGALCGLYARRAPLDALPERLCRDLSVPDASATRLSGEPATRWFFLCCCIVAIGGFPLLPSVLRMAEDGRYFGFQSDLPFWHDISQHLVDGASRRLGRRADPERVRLAARLRHSLGRPPAPALLWVWGLLPVVLVPIVCQGDLTSLANPRYRIGFAVPGCCFVAWLLIRNVRPLPAIVGRLVAALVTASLSEVPPWRLRRLGSVASHEWRKIARIVREKGIEGEPLFVQSGLGEGFLDPRDYRDPLSARLHRQPPGPVLSQASPSAVRPSLPVGEKRRHGPVLRGPPAGAAGVRTSRRPGSPRRPIPISTCSRSTAFSGSSGSSRRELDNEVFRHSRLIRYTLSPADRSE